MAKKPTKKITDRPTGTSKRLTLTEKILIRAEKGIKSVRKTAEEYGVTPSTVQKLWTKGEVGVSEKRVNTVKKVFSDRLYLIADDCVDQMHNAIFDASAKDAAIAMGICIEKARLIDDQSTQNVNNQHAFLDMINNSKV